MWPWWVLIKVKRLDRSWSYLLPDKMTTMPTWPWRRNPVRFHSQPIVPGVPLLLELTLKGRADIRETERADGRATDRVGRSVENSIEHRLLLVTVTSTHLHDFSSWIKLVLVCKWYIYTIKSQSPLLTGKESFDLDICAIWNSPGQICLGSRQSRTGSSPEQSN